MRAAQERLRALFLFAARKSRASAARRLADRRGRVGSRVAVVLRGGRRAAILRVAQCRPHARGRLHGGGGGCARRCRGLRVDVDRAGARQSRQGRRLRDGGRGRRGRSGGSSCCRGWSGGHSGRGCRSSRSGCRSGRSGSQSGRSSRCSGSSCRSSRSGCRGGWSGSQSGRSSRRAGSSCRSGRSLRRTGAGCRFHDRLGLRRGRGCREQGCKQRESAVSGHGGLLSC